MTALHGTLFVSGLQVSCILGDLPHERQTPQTIRIDLEAGVNFATVSVSDSVEDSVNYVALAHLAQEIAQQGQFHTVEALAVKISQTAFSEFPSLLKLQVRITKHGCIEQTEGAGGLFYAERPLFSKKS